MAPHVLTKLLSIAVRAVPGVIRLGVVPRGRGGVPGRHSAGIALRQDPEGVSVDCYLVAQHGANLLDVGVAAQLCVAAVIRELAGAEAHEVNVYIQDVAEPAPAGVSAVHG